MKTQYRSNDSPQARATRWSAWARRLLLCGIVVPFAACHSKNDAAPPPPVLAAPSILSVTTDDGSAEVEWTLVPQATSYNLYWCPGTTLDPATATCVRELARLRHRVTGLVNGNAYCYAVSANYGDKESAVCPFLCKSLAPGAVIELSIAPADASVTITWEPVHGAYGYAVYADTAPGVLKGQGRRIGPVQSPWQDTGLTNGTTYYYVVTAIGAGGESRESAEVFAKPMAPAPSAPQSPSVTIMEEAPNTLVVAWTPPAVGIVDSYNLYWGTAPGVTTASTAILDVTSPFVHSGLPGRTTYYYIVTAVHNGSESDPSIEVAGMPRGGSGSGHTSTLGNNLSFPLVFADEYGLTGAPLAFSPQPWLDFATALRPTATDVVDPWPFLSQQTIVSLNNVDYFPQKSTSTWQAQWRHEPGPPISVVADWGDNLTSASLTANKNIRIETVLYQDTTVSNPTETMTAYNMTLLSGSGVTELYGTDGTTYASNRWHVFTITPRLRIQKLQGPGGPVDPNVQGFDAAVYESFGGDEGSAGYAPEVNVSGKLVYGYVWMLKQWPLTNAEKVGWWRITFSLDQHAQFGSPPVNVPNRVFLTALDPSETVATLDPGNNSTSIEIELR